LHVIRRAEEQSAEAIAEEREPDILFAWARD
jgi:hypothetical protein